MNFSENKEYYLGLDIGTDSVGYAVTDPEYRLLKFKGEPMWGSHLFEGASTAAERRGFRTARRRLDRRQQRVTLVEEIFAPEIAKIDPAFFIRLSQSRLLREDCGERYSLFPASGYTDKDYHKDYPTIHHLIYELMQSDKPHDVRLVALACIWLVAHRGHFLFDTPVERASELLDFGLVYADFLAWIESDDNIFTLPWGRDVSAGEILDVLCRQTSISRKTELFKSSILKGAKPEKKKPEDEKPYSQEHLIKLLCGSKVSLADLFGNDEYKALETSSLSLSDDDSVFDAAVSALGDDGELLIMLRKLNDCAKLSVAQNGRSCISEAKIEVYEQHRADLKWLKAFVKKYIPEQFDEIFKNPGVNNYVAYSYNVSGLESDKAQSVGKKAGKTVFCDYIRSKIGKLTVEEKDRAAYEDALERMSAYTFMPKQKDSDNRVIPYQLYYVELDKLLTLAAGYLPFLNECPDGISAADKIRSVFTFRIPYFVGPLVKYGKNSWIERKADGKLYPWNFTSLVDLDKSESAFINRMTNKCTYLAGEDVLPKNSLLYCEFTVLNEINPIKVNDIPISVEAKQGIFENCFKKLARVTPKSIKNYLVCNGYMKKEDELSGIDIKINSSYKPYISFKRLLESGTISRDDVENIISRMAYSEDKARLKAWIKDNYPHLSDEDVKYISKLGYKEFGVFSKSFLDGIVGLVSETGELTTIIKAMRSTNRNLMQLLSEENGFRAEIEKHNAEYYSANPFSLEERLTQMRVSNAVKRPIYRTLDIVSDVTKAMKCAPKKVFVEMARDVKGEDRARKLSRREQLLELYKKIKTEEASAFRKELEAMGPDGDARLQSERLFLYYCQLGKCMYTGEAIELSKLSGDLYDVDHIFPRSKVKDDSIINNKVLVTKASNGAKGDKYPVASDIRAKMTEYWKYLNDNGLIGDEKYRRLTRATPFTDDELMGFINRQLVETRQSTKAITALLSERFGEDTEIVFVKAGLVSDFRHEFDILKCRSVNDLHHAKDAYLNIVVGNVYDMKFSKRWFALTDKYTLKTKEMFGRSITAGKETIWRGEEDIALVKKIMSKNNVHLTRYSFCRKGGFFDQKPIKASSGLVPLKKGLNTEKYGGYNKSSVSFYMLASYRDGKKKDIMLVPVETLYAEKVLSDRAYAIEYISNAISFIISGKPAEDVKILLDGRPIKINSTLDLDGLKMTISGKTSQGKQVVLRNLSPLVLGYEDEKYVKAIESLSEKLKLNENYYIDATHSVVSAEKNNALFKILLKKIAESCYKNCPGNIREAIKKGQKQFEGLSIKEQIAVLMNIIIWLGTGAGTCDLSLIGGLKKTGAKIASSKFSNYQKNYSKVTVVDSSASGLFETRSDNILEML